MNKETADKTWFVNTILGRKIVVGPPYLGDFNVDTSGKIKEVIDYPWDETAPQSLTLFDNETRTIKITNISKKQPHTIPLKSWEVSSYSDPIDNSFDDNSWYTLPNGNPPEIGQDGDTSPYAWYRTRITNNVPITSINFHKIGDRAIFFLDGKRIASYDFMVDTHSDIPVNIPSGIHTLAAFVAHAGRSKYAGYVGPIDLLQFQKGLRGPITFNEADEPILNWKMKGGVNPYDKTRTWLSVLKIDNTPSYFKTQLELDKLPDVGASYRIDCKELSFGCIWLNGHNIGRYPEILKECPGLWLPNCWIKTGINTLIIFDEQGKIPDKVTISLEASTSRHRVYVEE